LRKRDQTTLIVAIVGGSGSGKTWLAEQLQRALGKRAARLSLDDFYRDRSHLSPLRRRLVNFDHPRAIDWNVLEQALLRFLRRGRTQIPSYDFATHCRRTKGHVLAAKPVLLLEGLWLLRRASIRRLFTLSIFLDCPASTRLQRRIERDRISRGRTESSVTQQFSNVVQPMHQRYVLPQLSVADIVLRKPCDPGTVRALERRILSLLSR
jgi:uridine kinase